MMRPVAACFFYSVVLAGGMRSVYRHVPLVAVLLSAFCRAGEVPLQQSDKNVPSIEITVEQAAEEAGYHRIIEGVVAQVSQGKKGDLYLNFGAEFPNQIFSVRIPADGLGEKPLEHWVKHFQGKRVVVDGKIKLVKGKPEVELPWASKVVVK